MSEFARFLGNTRAGVLDPIVMLAPMSGISDISMRRVTQSFGATFVVSEMVDSEFYVARDAAARIKAEGQGIACHIVQIAGCKPDRMAEAARIAEAQGAAVIDLNMGCPAKNVVGGAAGSALMRDLDHATELIRATFAAVGIPVTVKMRLGWDHATINAPELARRAEAEGAAMVTVHGRTRCQFYKGAADWRAIRAVKAVVSIPVVANGDCTDLSDARSMLAASGADGVMIGRSAVGRPWILGEIATGLAGRVSPATGNEAKRSAAIEHYQTLLSIFGIEQGVRHARKHLAGYARHAGFSAESAQHRALVTEDDPDRVVPLLAALFDQREIEAPA